MNDIKEFKPMVVHPYIFLIENTTDVLQDWILFGSNIHLYADNFGNKAGVNVVSRNMMPYNAILVDFISNSIKTNIIRLQSDNQKNLETNLIMRNINFNKGIQRCEVLKNYFVPKDFLENVVNLNINIVIDKNTHLSGTIQPNSIIKVFIYPIPKINIQTKTKTHTLKKYISNLIGFFKNKMKKNTTNG